MSTTEAPHTQLDNVRYELQELQVENRRLRAEVNDKTGADQQESEILELRKQLHEAQENEVSNSEQLLQAHEQVNESHAAINELELLLKTAKSDNENLEAELAQAQARHELMVQEVEQVRERAELERFRAVEVERAKWEAREACLVAQLDECRDRSGEGHRLG